MNKPSSLLSKVAVLSGLALGAFALSAFAYSPWKGPTDNPPGNNADKPVQQYGNTFQDDVTGTLTLGSMVFAPGGAKSITDNQVLMSSGGNGTVVWGSAGSGSGIPGHAIIFNTPGSGTWTVPSGVTRVHVRVWGAGGGGGAYDGSNNGGGGGGGAYAEGYISVTPGAAVSYAVGSGGTAGYTGSGSSYRCGNDGGSSSFGSYVIATGGAAGHGSCGDNLGDAGGQGGSYSGSTVLFGIPGGGGTNGNSSYQSGGGNSPMGGQGTPPMNKGIAPSAPGGGGGGGIGTTGMQSGFNGANGMILIEY